MVKIEAGIKLGFNDVLIRPKRSKLKSRSAVNLNRTYRFLHSTQTWTGIPIIAANMDTTGTFENAIEFAKNRMMVALHKHYTIEEWLNFISIQKKNNNSDLFNYIAVSSGTSDNDYNKIIEILNKCPEIRFICLDIANGYSEHFVEYVKKVRNTFKNHIIFAGNVVTPEMTEQLLLSGADAVKVGIGPGSVCTTRKKTGVGYPQISAVLECADAAHGLGGLIISDGGCTMPGDFSKAFGAGADFVMAGGIFSGYDESGGELIIKNGKKYKQFYGMSSSVAMKKYHNGVSNYRASEGKCVLVPYKGKIANCLSTILGGIRSTCTYVGAAKLKELSKRCTFIQCIEHHNRVFGDEKQNDGYHQSEHQSPSKQKSKIGNIGSIDINDKQILLKFLYEGFGKNNNNKTEDKKEENDKENKDNSNNDKLEVYDNNINKQLGDCLDVNGNKNNNNNRKMEDVNIINLMSKDLKYEFFEWVYKKEQERIAKQCVNQAK